MARTGSFVVRIGVRDADTITRALQAMGKEGEAALRRLEKAAQSSSGRIGGMNRVFQQGVRALEGYASNLGVTGRVLGAFGPAALVATAGIGALVAAVGVAGRGFIELNDRAIRLDNSLKVVTSTTRELEQAYSAVLETGNKTGQSVNELGSLYSKAALQAQQLGLSQQELEKFVRAVALGLSVQGVTSEQARGPLMQLGQSLGSIIVRAEEFNSVFEGTPRIAKALTEGILGVNGSMTEFRQMMLAGEISGRDMVQALVSQLPVLQREFNETQRTSGQAMTILQNNLQDLVREFEHGTAAGRTFIGAVLALGKAFGNLAEDIKVANSPLGQYIDLQKQIALLEQPSTFGGLSRTEEGRLKILKQRAEIAKQLSLDEEEAERRRRQAESTAARARLPGELETATRPPPVARPEEDKTFQAAIAKREKATEDLRAKIRQSEADVLEGNKRISEAFEIRRQMAIEEFQRQAESSTLSAEETAKGLQSINARFAQEQARAQETATKRGARGAETADRSAEQHRRGLEQLQQLEEAALRSSGRIAEANELRMQRDIASWQQEATEAKLSAEETAKGIQLIQDAAVAERQRETDEFVADMRRSLQELREKQAEDQSKFTDSVIEDYLRATDQYVVLINRERDAKLKQLEELGFAEAEAAALRVQINATASRDITEARRQQLENATDLSSGFQLAFTEMTEEANNFATLGQDVFTDSVHGMAEAVSIFAVQGASDLSDFAENFAERMAMMTTQALAFRAIVLSINAATGGTLFGPSGGTDYVGQMQSGQIPTYFHRGGIVGKEGQRRYVHPAAFADAPRFHSGWPRSNEVPAVLEKGEMVLTKGQQQVLSDRPSVVNNVQVINNHPNAGVRQEEQPNASGGVDLRVIIDAIGGEMGAQARKPGTSLNRGIAAGLQPWRSR